MQQTVLQCPACGAADLGDGIIYNAYQLKNCHRCRFVFTAQRNFSSSHYEDVYSGVTAYRMMLDDARLTYEGIKGYRELWWFKRMALRWIRSRMSRGKLLDVGSGPGTFLLVARRDYGFAVQGVEPASKAADVANEFGVQTYCGSLEDFEGKHPGEFDAITSFEVLEHVSDPLSLLTTARKLLRKKGALIMSVPNLDDPYCLRQQIAPAMPPIHINFFSRASLKPLLDRAGFDLRRSFTLPIPTSSVRNMYGRGGFLRRLPFLVAKRLMGMADGTTLLVMATPRDK